MTNNPWNLWQEEEAKAFVTKRAFDDITADTLSASRHQWFNVMKSAESSNENVLKDKLIGLVSSSRSFRPIIPSIDVGGNS